MASQMLCACVGADFLRWNGLGASSLKKSGLSSKTLNWQPLNLRQSRRRPSGPSAAFASEGFSDGESSLKSPSADDPYGDSTFCIIEGRDTVLDFAPMQLQEIREHINMRRNKIFLLMEEVRRLRIQQRVKAADQNLPVEDEAEDVPSFPSFIPFLPPLTPHTLKHYYITCFSLISGIMLFAGLLAPALELRLGIGGTSYADFIHNMHLPEQLSQVDPIVASFSGGAVGVISSLMVVELNNVKQQEHKRCTYCHGTGYLACARCSGSGTLISMESLVSAGGGGGTKTMSKPVSTKCSNCAGAAKVMCPTCLCTGMALASEHDPRIDPFSI
ncbi:unnamed protein product [Calypogeia fissa]